MDVLLAAVFGALAGALVVAVVLRARTQTRPTPTVVEVGEDRVPVLARRLLDLMDPAVVFLDPEGLVLLANPAARALGVVRGARVLVPELTALADQVRRVGSMRLDVALPGHVVGAGPRVVGVQGVRLESGTVPEAGPVALVLSDVTEARRVEDVRRDFVANVGHELKTPVGALSLLAEAIEGAADDPVAVQRFAARISHEAERLGRLVRELIDLSRLQGADPLPELRPVRVDGVLAEAIDRTRMAAAAKDIGLAVGDAPELVVRGVETQLVTAVTNLLANAVVYSPRGARIAVGARARSGFGEITVTDTGVGIPRAARSRIFERFYRVDESRASSTGGTGLGLAIVKHVATNHGGSVSVWSEEQVGSTFTLRIPLAEPGGRPGLPVEAGDAAGHESAAGTKGRS